jgi:hypothetical protein
VVLLNCLNIKRFLYLFLSFNLEPASLGKTAVFATAKGPHAEFVKEVSKTIDLQGFGLLEALFV